MLKSIKTHAAKSISKSLFKSPQTIQKRFLNIHEHQSHEILRKFGIAVPEGKVAFSPEEAFAIAKDLTKKKHVDFVVKSQILAGGRGKGTFTNGFKGGVHVAMSPEKVKDLAEKMLGQNLVTKQTGAEGKPVERVYVQERVYARRELYFAILMDRAFDGPVMIASQRGGMNIEDVAKETPDEIFKEPISITKGIQPEQAERMARHLGFAGQTLTQAADTITKLYELFIKNDATLVEINPMIETSDQKVLCADCKLNFDDNAEFRHVDLFKLRDTTQEDAREVQASKFGLNYIGLDGNIGCIVNGAGLAMATMDIIKLHGGSASNFLDVGGGANKEQVTEAFKILQADPRVEAILVNIFGGIMRCDVIALGIIDAAKQTNLNVPLVVRLKGTRVEEGKKLIEESGLKIFFADELDDAASKAVRMSEIMKMAKQIDVRINFELPI